MRSSHLFTFVALAVGASACANDASHADDPEALGVARSAIVGGTPSTASQDAVVMLMGRDAKGRVDVSCTATLVASNLVVTARHCVSYSKEDSIICDQDGRDITGGAAIVGERKPSDVGIVLGNRRAESNTVRVAARGRKVILPSSATLCGADIAFVVLDKELPTAAIAPIRTRGGPALGSRVTVVGWGVTSDGSEPSERQQRTELDIRRIGPQPATGSVPPLVAGEFELGESICAGDSGGPAFDGTTGALLGVVSRGGNGLRRLPESCLGERVVNAYTSLSSFEELARSAFAAAGRQPWIEGEERPVVEPDSGTEETSSCAASPVHAQGSSWALFALVGALVGAIGSRRRMGLRASLADELNKLSSARTPNEQNVHRRADGSTDPRLSAGHATCSVDRMLENTTHSKLFALITSLAVAGIVVASLVGCSARNDASEVAASESAVAAAPAVYPCASPQSVVACRNKNLGDVCGNELSLHKQTCQSTGGAIGPDGKPMPIPADPNEGPAAGVICNVCGWAAQQPQPGAPAENSPFIPAE